MTARHGEALLDEQHGRVLLDGAERLDEVLDKFARLTGARRAP